MRHRPLAPTPPPPTTCSTRTRSGVGPGDAEGGPALGGLARLDLMGLALVPDAWTAVAIASDRGTCRPDAVIPHGVHESGLPDSSGRRNAGAPWNRGGVTVPTAGGMLGIRS